MLKFKRILCPTDFSRFSFRAADYAVALAKHYDGSVHFLHVVPDIASVAEPVPHLDRALVPDPELRKRASERLDAFVALARAEQIDSRYSVEDGTPVTAILKTAAADDADLICLGTHGREGFERLVLGSVAEKVLRKASCPVLTVSEQGEEASLDPATFENILCPIDFATLSMRALEHALSLAQEAGGRLTLLNVVEWFTEEPGWESEGELPDYRKDMEGKMLEELSKLVPKSARDWCEIETLTSSGKPYREILRVAEEKNTDLVIMGVRGRNPLDVMLFGSTTQHVVRRAPCPVLTVSGKESP